MKKVSKWIRKNIMLIVEIIGVVIFGGSVYAVEVYSKDITYNNSNSGLSSTNLQGAIDELYENANSGFNKGKQLAYKAFCYSGVINSSYQASCAASNTTNTLTIMYDNCVADGGPSCCAQAVDETRISAVKEYCTNNCGEDSKCEIVCVSMNYPIECMS